MTNPASTRKSSNNNCLIYGCLSVVILMVVGVLGAYLAVRYFINSNIERYTDSSPRQMADAALPEGEMQALQQRLKDFGRALQQTNQPARLTLDSRELNAVIASEPKLAALKDRLRVALGEDEIRCQVSLPLDAFAGVPLLGGLKGRHLNAELNLSARIENGKLTTRIAGATVKEFALPAEFISELEKNPPWQEFQKSPETRALINQIDWLKITDGQLEIGKGDVVP